MSCTAIPSSQSPAAKDIPLSNMQQQQQQPAAANPTQTPTSNANYNPDANTDLEAGLAHPEAAYTARESSEAPPDYKEHDMPEPLPPYMTRVRGVMRREQPIGAAMPVMKRHTGFFVIGVFVLVVLIVIGVGVGVRVANNSGNPTNTP